MRLVVAKAGAESAAVKPAISMSFFMDILPDV
jgi:hypothetical protein